MNNLIKQDNSCSAKETNTKNEIVEMSQYLISNILEGIDGKNVITVPISKLSTIGSGVSSMIPALNQVTQTSTLAADHLYRIANAGLGDSLKMAKNGNAWGALKTASGGSKMVQLQSADPLSITTNAAVALNPATMLMSVTLYSMQKQMDEIAETQKQILSFLEIEKESQIESDVKTLSNIVKNYSNSLNNDIWVKNNHKLVLDIQRAANKNMVSYRKQVDEISSKKQLLIAKGKIDSLLATSEHLFKYYQLSLYTYSLSTFMEVMLSGNFNEEYITNYKNEIETLGTEYRNLFNKQSIYLEKVGNLELEANAVKIAGIAEDAVGNLLGYIPLSKKAKTDEKLHDGAKRLKNNAADMKKSATYKFSGVANPGTGIFVEKLDTLSNIYNRTDEICFDDENIYLVANK